MRRSLAVLCVLVLVGAGVSASAEADPALVGRWSAPFWEGGSAAFDPPSAERSAMFPAAVSAVALPDGRVLYWNGLEGTEDGDVWVFKADGTSAAVNARSRILDLGEGEPAWEIPSLERGTTDEAKDRGPSSTSDMFCAGQTVLYDGTVLIAGGSEWRADMQNDPTGSDLYGDDEARVFDSGNNTFRPVDQMSEGRFYPTLVTLADGRVLVTSGVRRVGFGMTTPDPAASQVRLSELYDPATETWQDAGESEWSFPLYPRLHLMPDGTVLFGGAGQTWGQFGGAADMGTWSFRRVYDPATQEWTMLDANRYGTRSGATSTLLRLEAPYDRADILLAGGTLGPTPSSWMATTISELVHVTAGGIVAEPAMKGPFDGLNGDLTQLRNRRWFGTSVMLPTGEVLMVNGGDVDDVMDPGAAAAVRMAELYDPDTNEWRELSSGSRDRVYHSTAVLLADGRVLVGGNAPHTAHYYKHDNTLTRSNNYRDATFEIYEPPYLFRGDRPVVTSVTPVQEGRGLSLALGEGTAPGDISEVVLVRLAAITHTVDSDMRAVVLEHSVEGSTVVASLPRGGDGRIVPPGAYYVFAMRATDDGPVPSVAQAVRVQPDTANGGVVVTLP